MKHLALLATLLLSSVLMGAQNTASGRRAPAAQGKLPTQAEVEAVLKRIYGYDPSVQWKIFVIRRSPIPGMSEVLLNLKGEFKHLFLTADGHFAISGDLMQFGADPYGVARARLNAADGPVRGADKPAVVMVEFSDLQCPHCKDAQPVLEKLAADFPRMKIIFQQYPLQQHPWAMKAARYADCAAHMSNATAWKYIAAIYQNQGSIAEAIADDRLRKLPPRAASMRRRRRPAPHRLHRRHG
ncbi:MAG: DsbA family protein [Acidobacteriia bacterium]|nr:DsbA family protein [Terriglobia bacterium]